MSETKLTKRETDKKERLETIVDNWIEQALEAGKALMQIKKEKLYRVTHKTFELYVKERFSKTRQWAYDFCNWYQVNHLAERLEKPLSNNATTALSSVAKNSPSLVKEIVEESSKIAKKNNHDEPTKEDVKEAKLKVIPVNAPAPVSQRTPITGMTAPPVTAPVRVTRAMEVSVVVDKHNMMPIIQILDDLGANYEQTNREDELIIVAESISSFMLHVGRLLEKAESFEFSIMGKKVEVKKETA